MYLYQYCRLHLLSEEEKGAALSIFKDGELVVDMWGGYADIEAWQPWKQSTVANTFSLYNVAVSLSLGLLYERSAKYRSVHFFTWSLFLFFKIYDVTCSVTFLCKHTL